MELFPHPRPESWEALFDHSLREIQESWTHEWLGLPFVVSSCADFLDLNGANASDDGKSMLQAALRVAAEMERVFVDAGSEPSYHNRLHTAQVVTVMAIQASIETEKLAHAEPKWLAASLLVAVGHDFMHTGSINKSVSEIELFSCQQLLPFMQEAQMDELWQQKIITSITRSDFSLTSENHLRVLNAEFEWRQDWLTVLLNEADIMASAISIYGQYLSEALADEWRAINFPPQATVSTKEGRKRFLQSVYFSSPSARELNALKRVQDQIQAV
jgi:hypothetical protein